MASTRVAGPAPSAAEQKHHPRAVDLGRAGCDGDSVAMTSATSPSLEDLLTGVIPGSPKVVLHIPGARLRERRRVHAGLLRRRGGRARPVHPRARGVGADEQINGDGPLDRVRRQRVRRPADHRQRVDRPARAEGRGRAGHRDLRDLRRHPGDAQQPDRRDGPARLPRLGVDVARGPADRVPARLPRAARQHHRDAASTSRCSSTARARRPSSTSSCAPRGSSSARRARAATAPASPSRASSRRRTATTRAASSSSAARARSTKCNVPAARLGQRRRRLPERRRHLHRLHDARLPRQVHAVHGPRPVGQRGGQLPALHLRPAVPLLPQAQPDAEVRARAGVARAGRAHERVRDAR